MIAPEFRNCQVFNLKDNAKDFIETNHGHDLYATLQPSLNEIDEIKTQLLAAQQYRADPEQLKKFSELFAKHYCNSQLLMKYFSFGTTNQQINIKFTWFDSFSNIKVESTSPLLEAMSAKYNYGVALARLAVYMDLADDGIKQACKYMQNAAWIFEDLRETVVQLKPAEITADFTSESLGMIANLMLAQSQYLFYRMANEKKMKAEMLSKIAQKCSQYFGKAYQLSQCNHALKAFKNGTFAGVLAYHEKYFGAIALHVLTVGRFQQAKDDGKGMGHAAGTALLALQKFQQMKPLLTKITDDYKGNYNNKLAEAEKLYQMCSDKAKNVFFEAISEAKDIKLPEEKNFVKFDDSVKDQLEKVPPMNEILRFLVPPQVRKMQGEFKTQIQNQIDQLFKKMEQEGLDQRVFLGQYQLPQSYLEITAVAEFPDSYWNKIESFQKKGAISNFTNTLSSIEGLRQNCSDMIEQSKKLLKEEELEDDLCRSTFGVSWAQIPSSGIAQPYHQNVQTYSMKLQQAQNQDLATKQRFESQRSELDLLSKSKNELIQIMPEPASKQDLSQSPASQAIKSALDNIDQAQLRKEEIMKEMVQTLANLNMVEVLIQVYQGQLNKDTVFTEKKEVFNEFSQRMAAQQDIMKSANAVITSTFDDFQKLKKASSAVDPTRQQYFQRIDLCLMCQQDLETMISQGVLFYTRLTEHLINLQQNIQDFKISRTMQREDLCSKMGKPMPKMALQSELTKPPVNYNFDLFVPPE